MKWQAQLHAALEAVESTPPAACERCWMEDYGSEATTPTRPVEKRDFAIQTCPMFEVTDSIPHIDSEDEEDWNTRHGIDSRYAAAAAGSISTGTMTRKSRHLVQPKSIDEMPRKVLFSGVYLPGIKDVQNRNVVTVDGHILQKEDLRSQELARLLLYYISLLDEEELRCGVMMLVDVGPNDHLLELIDDVLALIINTAPIKAVVLKGLNEPPPQVPLPKSKVKVELVCNEASLWKSHVPKVALHYQEDWVEFFKVAEKIRSLTSAAIQRLTCLANELLTGDQHHKHKALAKALADPDVVRLRLEGADGLAIMGTLAKRLSFSCHIDRHAQAVSNQFDLVDQLIKRLEMLHNLQKQQQQQFLRMRTVEDELNQVLQWITKRGENGIKKHSELATSWQGIKVQEEDFEQFYFVAMRHIDKGGDLVDAALTPTNSSASSNEQLQELAKDAKNRLLSFTERLETTRERLEDTARAFCLVDKAYEWALKTTKFLNRVRSEDGCNEAAIQQRLSTQVPLSEAHFAEMTALAKKLDNERLMEAVRASQERHQEALQAVQTALGGIAVVPSRRRSLPTLPSHDCRCVSPKLGDIRETENDFEDEWAGKRGLRRTCTWQYPAESFDDPELLSKSDSDQQSKSSGEDCDPVPPSFNSHLYYITRASNLSLDLDDVQIADPKVQKTLLFIMREMIQTEKDYVASLEYVIEHYMPELLREDIPQTLRGQRNALFGNIEKIYEFHSQHFLQELMRCEKRPLAVGDSFLKHENKFYLYALYNKNKPKSDSLIAECGSRFFRTKQLELGDKMDLGSYLLKPVQRMGKYALLLQQLMKAAGNQSNDHLAAAESMVRFQLRHGNDLLAMDSLRDCDVNLKEQGRLLRQNEFLVWQGKGRKCLRHVFLFEELILFSKARRFPDRKNLDLYIYKNSIKTTDIGLTAKVGDSATKFEIWYRKRKPSDTFTLQSSSEDIKTAWIEELSTLLWKQALKNREVRLQEMSSMGIGNKPCLDIRPSADQISDRSITVRQLNKTMPRFRNSIATITSDFRLSKRPQSTISVSSSSSSGGSWNSRNTDGSRLFTSPLSTESGIVADMSTTCDELSRWTLDDSKNNSLERSNSSLTSDSVESSISPPASSSSDDPHNFL